MKPVKNPSWVVAVCVVAYIALSPDGFSINVDVIDIFDHCLHVEKS